MRPTLDRCQSYWCISCNTSKLQVMLVYQKALDARQRCAPLHADPCCAPAICVPTSQSHGGTSASEQATVFERRRRKEATVGSQPRAGVRLCGRGVWRIPSSSSDEFRVLGGFIGRQSAVPLKSRRIKGNGSVVQRHTRRPSG